MRLDPCQRKDSTVNIKILSMAFVMAAVTTTAQAAQRNHAIQHAGGFGMTNDAAAVVPVGCLGCADDGCDAATCDEGACDCGEPACGCEIPACGCEAMDACVADGCDAGCDDFGGCDSGCGSFCGGGELGDPWTLKSVLAPCCDIDFGGWTQLGYHSNNTRLSFTDNDSLAFNDHPDRLNLHQQWLWFEKAADGSNGLDWGFRFDSVYGIDASKTQAFGNNPGRFDFQNGFDRGDGYGWALPQLYGELAAGDWSVIVGHFYTLVGYEVVTAPDNFFYSHALTMFNSEPFTHTGALATYSGIDDIEFYGGWTAGWDTGFDQSNSGSNFLGGFSATLSDALTFTYITTIGNFGARSGGEDGYSHSLVFDATLSDNLNYVFQSDLLAHENSDLGANDQVGINQYLFYTMSDRMALGGRAEWWKTDGTSFYQTTAGINYKPCANVTFRPEIRYDWSPSTVTASDFVGGEPYNQSTFGMDAILTF